jgi:hypothetical protein
MMKLTIAIQLSISLILSSLLLLACSHNKLNTITLDLPLKPYLQVDNFASEITFKQLKVKSKQQPKVYKRVLSQKIEKLLNRDRITSDAILPIRYKINVSYYETNYISSIFPCLLYFTVIGCPKSFTNIRIDVHLEAMKYIYKASAQDTYYSSFYYNHEGIYSLENTIAKAFKRIARRMKKNLYNKSKVTN